MNTHDAPRSYEELFLLCFPMLRGIAKNAGIAAEDIEDVAMELLTKFLSKDGLSWYDPNMLHDVGDNPEVAGDRYRTAKFKTMLRSWASKAVLNERDKQQRKQTREPWRLEASMDGEEGGTTWRESEEYAEESLEITENQVVIRAAILRTREILVTRSTPKRDYGRFIDLVIEGGLLDGTLDRRAVQETLQISASTLTQMIQDLRTIMAPLLCDTRLLSPVKRATLSLVTGAA